MAARSRAPRGARRERGARALRDRPRRRAARASPEGHTTGGRAATRALRVGSELQRRSARSARLDPLEARRLLPRPAGGFQRASRRTLRLSDRAPRARAEPGARRRALRVRSRPRSRIRRPARRGARVVPGHDVRLLGDPRAGLPDPPREHLVRLPSGQALPQLLALSPLERALLAVIASRSGCAELAYARRPESLAGGYWAEISAFSLAAAPRGFAGELILRRMPSSPRTRIEIAVHTAAYELGFPTPRVRAFGGADEALGRSFVIMDRAGRTTLDQVQGARERVGRIRVLPRLLAQAHGRLHALSEEPLVERLAN